MARDAPHRMFASELLARLAWHGGGDACFDEAGVEVVRVVIPEHYTPHRPETGVGKHKLLRGAAVRHVGMSG